MRASAFLTLIAACAALSACSAGQSDAVRIGFIGDLSGRYADLGRDGRDGSLLAVEQQNAQGGLHGQRIELREGDDQQDASRARQVLDTLMERKVAAVIGPMTSAMAVALVPRLEGSNTVMIGVHTTTTELTGRDDQFFRVIDDTHKYAGEVARFHFNRRRAHSVAIAYDLANVDYSESWVADYRRSFSAQGGVVVRLIAFDSHYDHRYEAMASALLEVEPEMVVIVANALDTAELAAKIRARHKHVQIAGCGWAATERLLERGGPQIEGLVMENYIKEADYSASYQQFRRAFIQRFKREPSYGAVMAFEATTVVITALQADPDPTRLKRTLLSIGSFRGVQGDIRFDSYGDVHRPVHFAEVRNGHFAYFDDAPPRAIPPTGN